MENSYFIFSDGDEKICLDKFHICTWEFRNGTSLVEFGLEINHQSLTGKMELDLSLFIPWLSKSCNPIDFYPRLSNSTNSRFIFNDYIKTTESFDGGSNHTGVLYSFISREPLCILPVTIASDTGSSIIKMHIDLKAYQNYGQGNEGEPANVYIRFSVTPQLSYISTRKKGISKSTIIYDIKLNERRNIPEASINEIGQKQFCEIEKCFCFNIVPNNYDLVFFDSSSLKNVRTLEFDSFNRYLGDSRVKNDELIVIFSKKNKDDPFSFFAIYSKERIGAGQFAVALLINFISGILLFIPSFRKSFNPELTLLKVWPQLPVEIYIASAICLTTILFFVFPYINSFRLAIWRWLKNIVIK